MVAELGEARKPTLITIGNFDGVHLGHQKILSGVVARAREQNCVPAVLTFFPHPARVLRPSQAPPLLMTLTQRVAAIGATGIEAALVLSFDNSLSLMSAEDFVKTFVVGTLRARAVMVGGNFRFGHNQAGDARLLVELGRRWGFEEHIVPPVEVGGVVVSSSEIRQTLAEGNVEQAARFLGRPFALSGEIRPGTGQGRKLVVPTLNLATEQECVPKLGVYATETVVEEKSYRSATNVGVRPTFDGRRVAIESHLLDFSKDLTSGPMEILFLKRLRDEEKFSGPAELKAQVLKDIAQVKEFIAVAAPKRRA